MNIMLTNPDVLADYVNDFFGPEGPYPTETPEETALVSKLKLVLSSKLKSKLKSKVVFLNSSSVPKWRCRPLVVKSTSLTTSGAAFSEMMDIPP